MVLKVDIWELDAMKQGARVQVILRNKGKNIEEMVWDFEIGPDAMSYIGETREFDIGTELEEVIIKVFAEGEVSQSIGTVNVLVNEIIADHLTSDLGYAIKRNLGRLNL